LPHQWKESIVVPIHKKNDETDCSNYRGISLLSTSYKIVSNILLSRLIPYADERLISFSIPVRYWRKIGSIMAEYIIYLYISRKLMIQLGGKHYTTFSLSSEYTGNQWG
jgi:hypothetical protein